MKVKNACYGRKNLFIVKMYVSKVLHKLFNNLEFHMCPSEKCVYLLNLSKRDYGRNNYEH